MTRAECESLVTNGFYTGLETRELCADIVRHGREQAQGEIIFILDFFIFLFPIRNLKTSSGLSDRSQILGQQPSFPASGMSWSMIGVLTRELYKPLGIPSHFLPPHPASQGVPHSPYPKSHGTRLSDRHFLVYGLLKADPPQTLLHSTPSTTPA